MRNILAMLTSVLVLCSSGTSLYAAPQCSADAIDPDGDGWGWENNASCRMPMNIPPVIPVCSNAQTDADGDGWGWENGKSCRVSGVTPGDSYETAGVVALDSDIRGRVSGLGLHYYKFDVETPLSVELIVSDATSFDYDISVEDSANQRYLESFFGENVCLQSGTYFVVVDRFFVSQNEAEYSVRVNQTDRTCIEPDSEFSLSDAFNVKISRQGEVFESDFYTLTKRDISGTQLWQTTFESGLDDFLPLDDGAVLVNLSGQLSKLDALGQTVWSTVYEGFLTDLKASGNTAIMVQEQNIQKVDLTTGSNVWNYGVGVRAFVRNIAITEDDRVMLHVGEFSTGGSKVLIFTQ